MTPIDKHALERAMEIAQRNPDRRWQLERKRESESWEDVAAFAAHVCQTQALGLKPFEQPPCSVSENAIDDSVGPLTARSLPAARQLFRRLLAACLSRYEPDPLAALARVEKHGRA